DPRNYLGLGEFDLVPTKLLPTTLLETASDDWFGDLDGDELPDLAVGRIPVRTREEADTVVAKVLAYEAGPRGPWADQVLLVADENDTFDFEGASRRVEELLPPGMSFDEVFVRQSGREAARAQLLASLDQGRLIVNYVGHGSVEVWGGEGLF